jgi:hypothetical protein
MFLDAAVMHVMQVSIVQIIDMTFVRYGHMPTLRAVLVSVRSVLVACGVHKALTSNTITPKQFLRTNQDNFSFSCASSTDTHLSRV